MSVFTQFGLPPSVKRSAQFPAWSPKNIRTVELAIVTAWQCLAKTTATKRVLDSGTEVEISTQLLDALCSLLNTTSVKGFTGYVFEPPIRGQELEDVTGNELEKRPDISIRLRISIPFTQHNSLFFECKRISPTRTIADYVNEGLLKFCDQRYAWGMPHAGMLAYVQDIEPTPQANIELEKYWVKNPTSSTVPICDLNVESSGSIAVTITKHQRHMPLPSGSSSGDITLRHLWLST